jgi:hypothetical protein
MIDRQHGRVIIDCDVCDDTFEGQRGEEFESVWAGARREGWTTRKIANEWLHACPGCKL